MKYLIEIGKEESVFVKDFLLKWGARSVRACCCGRIGH